MEIGNLETARNCVLRTCKCTSMVQISKLESVFFKNIVYNYFKQYVQRQKSDLKSLVGLSVLLWNRKSAIKLKINYPAVKNSSLIFVVPSF
jgi:hypothetical protein